MALSACTSAQSTPAPDLSLEGTEWSYIATNLEDIWLEPVPNTEITIKFTRDEVSGSAGCNQFFGQYELVGDQLKIGPVGTTRMLCEDEIQHQEDVFLENLANVTSVEFVEQVAHFSMTERTSLVFGRDFHKQIIDHGGLHTFETCTASGGELIGPGNQCVIDQTVYFEDYRPQISLNSCSGYFDGCNYLTVSGGSLGATTLAACFEELDPPACYEGDLRVSTYSGQVVETSEDELSLKVGDIVHSILIAPGSELSVQVRNLSAETRLTVKVGQSDKDDRATLLAIVDSY
jgi:heat shock protein HslJ